MIEKREWKHMTELIIKYYGDISRVTELASDVTLLLCGYAIITIEEEDIVELTNIPEVIFVEYPRRIFEEAYGDYVLCQNPIQNRLGLYGEGTIVAIIDTGVETTNKVFGERANQLDTSGYINRETPSGILSFQHGTAVASIAAGEFESGAGLATRAEILSVAVTEGRERSFYRTSEVMKAIDVAVRYAIRQKKPLAVNVSFGNSYGPHDGTGLLERYIDCVSSIWRLSIIVGMGNEGASDIHYAGKFEKQREGIAYYDTTKSQDILISVGEFERELIISLWKNFGDDMAVEIFSPNGDSTGIIYDVEMGNTGMNSNVTRISLSGTTGFVRYQTATPYTSKSEIYIELTKENGYVPQGVYILRIIPGSIKYGVYNIWLPTSSRNISFFMPETGERTLTVPATASSVISVGAYDSSNEEYAFFSGRGYECFSYVKPDVVAQGVMVPAILSGTDNIAMFTGTSFATPIITGVAAMLMGWGIVEGNDRELYGEKVRAYLRKSAIQLRSEITPSVRTGYGVVCLSDMF